MTQDMRVVDTPTVYLPIDRRIALAQGETLPEKTQGTGLFADISGFTPLTEALTVELGPKRGAEELTVHLNQVYGALIAELHRYGGSVISFSGDAITCWLDGDDGRRGLAAALAMQQAMAQFAEVRTVSGRVVSLAMKVAVASGVVRRFIVGDPAYQRIDTMAGETLVKLAAAEHLLGRGEIGLDETAVNNLGTALNIHEWRVDTESGWRFAVVDDLSLQVSETPWPASSEIVLDESLKASWLLPRVYDRLTQGLGEFLAEIRPVYSLFLRFTGIDYDGDPQAPYKLDKFVREAQRIFTRLDGSMTSLTIGDKGSYFSIAFGAPVAHEDDALRAAATALALHDLVNGLPYLEAVQIGITSGRVRSGAYGSTTRRTYSVIGDPVNLSARLMAAAKPGQTLAEEEVQEATGDRFVWERLPSVRVKGKHDLVAVSHLVGQRKSRASSRLEPQYQLPMVGRAQDLALIKKKLALAGLGQGQVVGITAEAGMGKSRLAAEVIHAARESSVTCLAGECQSYGTTTSYLVWQGVWRGFFDLDPALSLEAQVESLEKQLERLDPSLLPRLPLLGAVLNLAIPDNDLTRSLDAEVRKSSLQDFLTRCLEIRSRIEPLMLILEDCHWLDDLSRELIGVLGRAVGKMPVLLLLVYRPADRLQQQAPPVQTLPHFIEITLTRFSDDETRQLVELKLAQSMGEETPVPEALLARVSTQAVGNPFYVEELLNYFQDVDVDLQDMEALEKVDLPDSLYSLVLSRIDRLDESEQLTIKIASVIGRLFRAAMLWGVYPELPLNQVQHNLDVLSHLELTPLDTPLPELAYLFKHIVTQQVAYESLLHSTRAMLHEQIGLYTERSYPDTLEQYTNLLAFHFDNSENLPKRKLYLRKAAEAAQRDYANGAAINYYERLIALLDQAEQGTALFNLGAVFDVIGEFAQAEQRYKEALPLAEEQEDAVLQAKCQIALGELFRKQGDYNEAEAWLKDAQVVTEQSGDQSGLATVYIVAGGIEYLKGNSEQAAKLYEQSLAIRRQLNDQSYVANVLNNIAILAASQGDFAQAQQRFEEALEIHRALDGQWAIARSLNNLGELAMLRGNYADSLIYLDEALSIQREIGIKWSLMNSLITLGNVLKARGEFAAAYDRLAEAMELNGDLGDIWTYANLFEAVGGLLVLTGDVNRGLNLIGFAAKIREQISSPLSSAENTELEKVLTSARESLGEETAEAALTKGQTLELEDAIDLALTTDFGET